MSKKAEELLTDIKADIKKVSENTYIVSKVTSYSSNKIFFEKNKSYVIQLLTSDTANNIRTIINDNWNKGRPTSSSFIQCEVRQISGNMIQIDGVGYNPDLNQCTQDIYFNYWIDTNTVQIVSILL